MKHKLGLGNVYKSNILYHFIQNSINKIHIEFASKWWQLPPNS
jgi:hypothetical protein